MRGRSRSGAAARPLAALCLAAALLGPRAPAAAGILGSRHDFSPLSIGAQGACGACHVTHSASAPSLLWARPLTEEAAFFNQTADPNYAVPFTLLCYDCHDDNAARTTVLIDDDPPRNMWTSGEEPQNVAFTDVVPPAYTTTRTQPGYYELARGVVPSPGNGGPVDGSATGGHYWKSEPSGTPDFERGDKIACDLCHDPHDRGTGGNEVMLREYVDDGAGGTVNLGGGLDAAAPPNTRNGSGDGRAMCAACHGYWDSGSPVFLWGFTLPRPPQVMPEHYTADPTPCTNCHKHNKISYSCKECHGYPPLLTEAEAGGLFDAELRPDAESYADVAGVGGGAGAHQRHKDVLGPALFNCQICHGPRGGSASWHNEGGGVVSRGNVDIMGQSAYWDRDNSRPDGTRRYTGVDSSETREAGWEFVAKGGGEQRCANLSCHGDPPEASGALTWGADMTDGDVPDRPDNAADVRICKWCHDSSQAVLDLGAGVFRAPNVLGNNSGAGGSWSGGTWGADVNGHGLASGSNYDNDGIGDALGSSGAAQECDVCHDGAYIGNVAPPPTNVPRYAHFDGAYDSAQKRLRTSIVGQPVAGPDDTCLACHRLTTTGARVSHHGNSTAGGYGPALEPPFTRVCRQCHNVHGANWNGAGRNLFMIGRWLDVDRDGVGDATEGARVDSNATTSTTDITTADNAVVFTNRTGANSFDEAGEVVNALQDADDICATCHYTLDANRTKGGDHSGTAGMSDERGNNCIQCHQHEYDANPVTSDGFMPICEECHGQRGNVHPGLDEVAGTDDDAPNVVSSDVSGTLVDVWNGTWWDQTQGGNNATQQGGHGDTDGVEGGDQARRIRCPACHNLGTPTPNTHLDGTYTSLGTELPMPWMGGVPRGKGAWGISRPYPNENTSHVRTEFFTEFGTGSGNNESWQVAMDAYCYLKCHDGNGVQAMTHERDGGPPVGAVSLGTHLTSDAPPDAIMDSDITTNAGGAPHFAPCVSCHNPHGSINTDVRGIGLSGATNHMLMYDWYRNSVLCAKCHI